MKKISLDLNLEFAIEAWDILEPRASRQVDSVKLLSVKNIIFCLSLDADSYLYAFNAAIITFVAFNQNIIKVIVNNIDASKMQAKEIYLLKNNNKLVIELHFKEEQDAKAASSLLFFKKTCTQTDEESFNSALNKSKKKLTDDEIIFELEKYI